MTKTILIFGGLSIAVLLLFQLNQMSLASTRTSTDLFVVLSGCLFLLIGFFVSKFVFAQSTARESRSAARGYRGVAGLSRQEFNVLNLMADGLSNLQIAKHLSISENTVKTHVSKVLAKLNAKRRTEAVKIGRDLDIL